MSKTYYVSALGCDQNDGLSPEKPLQTLAAVEKVGEPGDRVLFRRGDTWRAQHMYCRNGVTYSAYGEGEAPRFYGSAYNYADGTFWTATEDAVIWRCDLDFDGDVCHIVFDDGAAWSVRKHSCAELSEDLDYYYDGDAKAVFLRSDTHPATRFSVIELGKGSLFNIPLADGRDIVIRDLCFMYCNYAILTHCDRVGDVRNIRIEYCKFAWIGGHEGTYFPGGVRDGNAITIWGSARQIVVDHCEFTQLFDTAFTPQCGAPPNSDVVFEDITLSNCRIEGCHWSTEFWIHVKDDNGGQLGTIRNIYIENNHFIGAGEGWAACQRWNGGPPASASHIQTFSGEECAVIENVCIRDNIFDRASHDLISFHWQNAMPILEGNTYIQVKGRPFAHMGGKEYLFDDHAEETIRQFDKTAIVRFADRPEELPLSNNDEKTYCHIH